MHKLHFIASDTIDKVWNRPAAMWDYQQPHQLQECCIDQPERAVTVEIIPAYTAEHLFVFVRSNQQTVSGRDRGYQNGDGLHFVLARPCQDGAASTEFYVVGISPFDKGRQRKFIWYKNIDLTFIPLEGTDVRHSTESAWQYFAVRTPWHELTPYHPWLDRLIGFNLSYVQAVPDGRNTYMLRRDERIQSEQSPRLYATFSPIYPRNAHILKGVSRLSSKHATQGALLTLELVLNSPRTQTLEFSFTVDESAPVTFSAQLQPGINRLHQPIATAGLAPGEHSVRVGGQWKGNEHFFIYRTDELAEISRAVNSLTHQLPPDEISKESVTFLKFKVKELRDKFGALKPQDNFGDLAREMAATWSLLRTVQAGSNHFVPGARIRAAICSRQDNSLQPYSIYIPKGTATPRQLLIYLHGSGEDDRSLFNSTQMLKLAEDLHVILVAPFARGTSHAYVPWEALEDIAEVTQKVQQLFAISPRNTKLSGFSMGGYGVLRAYEHNPTLFSGLALISGHPSLAEAWGMEGPDYTNQEALAMFKDVPIIIFHGTEDRNCPFPLIERLHSQLTQINPHVQLHVAKEAGHIGLDDKWRFHLQRWAESID
ncbi:MAG: hypothetical protein FH749_12745 [Firmicutes bacterium]|nr:hypothetical protein [Bacillota bacterium]